MGIIRFFDKIERCLLRFRIGALVEDWRKGGERVVIYGAGFHTKNLLDVTSLCEAKIVGVSDSDPNKHGTDCRGNYVIKPEDILKSKPDIVLISSKDHEGEIYNQLRFMEKEGVELVRIYAGSAMSGLFKAQGYILRCYEGIWLAIFGLREKLRTASLWSPWNANSIGRQRTLVWDVTLPEFETARDFVSWLHSHGLRVKEGGHTIYIPPQAELAALLPSIVGFYPQNAGFKILKDFRAPEEANYSVEGIGNPAHSKYTEKPLGQQVTVNYMHALGIGPRLWDLCAWKSRSSSYTVFVVDHVSGNAPSERECNAFLCDMKRQLSVSHLRIAMPGWEQREDFSCPNCNGNMILSEKHKYPQYLDFQYFTCAPDAWTKEVVLKADDAFHFGDSWLTNKPLYQSVPGSVSVGKRNTGKRWEFVAELLRKADLSINGRIVLDVGCNAGMMLHSSLVAGAAWAIGWDRPAIVPFTRDLLFSLGATRFRLVGATLNRKYPLEDDIPGHLKPMLSEAVVFYFSVHDHIGLLDSLKVIPWRVLVYEGHQAERMEDACAALGPLLDDKIQIVTSSYIDVQDGDADARPIVVLKRNE